ncbi:MAG: HEPN domain-containing protein [Methylococcaceae bacterium]
MYAEKLNHFENTENLGGKAWEHAVACDVISKTAIKDCAMHCFHYQQMFEMLFKYILETKSEFGAFSKTHKLQRLLEEVIANTPFKTDKSKYFMALQVISVCAEEYRYNFLIDCEGYKLSTTIADELLEQLLEFIG